MHRMMLQLALCSTCLMLVACNPPAPTSDAPPPSADADVLPIDVYPQIVTIDGLGKYMRFSPPSVVESTEGKPMTVSAPVRSTHRSGQVNVQYRFEFFNADGQLLDSSQGWQFKVFEPRVQYFLQGAALDAAAVDWRLVIRPAR